MKDIKEMICDPATIGLIVFILSISYIGAIQ